jgi:uncharacterized protein (DUF305 family)
VSRLTAPLVVVLLLLGAGCTTKTEIRPADPADFPTATAPSPHNETDAAYARALGVLHEQAVDLAGLARGRETSAAVGDLAAQVQRTRLSWMVSLDALRGSWGVEPPASDYLGNPGEVSRRQLAQLNRLDGPELEARWLARMIANYRSSIALSRTELDLGVSEAGRQYATQVIADLEADLEALERLTER